MPPGYASGKRQGFCFFSVLYFFANVIVLIYFYTSCCLMDLEKYRVQQAPHTVYYISEYITEAEEDFLIKNVNFAPKPKWTQLSSRRLQNWGGIPHSRGMVAEKIPPWLQTYVSRVGEMGLFAPGIMPNHVLVNEYCPSQGIMPHTDGPLFYPTVTTISCGSHTKLEFKPRMDDADHLFQGNSSKCQQKTEFSLLLERRSLVVLQDEVYTNYLHSIAEVNSDDVCSKLVNLHLCKNQYKENEQLVRGTRISLTIRHVPSATKVLLRLSK